jgi:predicted esterase
VDFVPKSGRALVFPIYTGMFERQDGLGMWDGQQVAKRRDRMIYISKDLGRTLDYLESREDIDSARMAYLGFSAGGAMAPLLLGVEQRFNAAILLSGGFWFRFQPPEADFINFVTRVRVPVLMLNDRYDNTFPPESSQLPLFHLLGTPEKDKKRMVFDTGHGGVPQKDVIRESLAWFDKYLGPVKAKAGDGR